MYKYTVINDKIGKIELDGYNRSDSELTIVEGKIVKESDDILAVYVVLVGGDYSNIVKSIKLPDGKYGADPSFKITDEMPLLKLDIPLTIIKKTAKSGKEYSVGSVAENFIANKLLSDFGDGGLFEGTIDLGVDKIAIDKYEEYIGYGDKGKVKAETALSLFYECSKIDTLTFITDEIVAIGSTANNSKGGGKSYPKAETEAEKLNARLEFTKRFLSDNWDKSIDLSTTSFDDALTMFEGRESVQKRDSGHLLLEILKAILS